MRRFSYKLHICALSCFMVFGAAFLSSCNDDDNQNNVYLRLSDNSYTFTNEGNDTFTVMIESSSPVEADNSTANWVGAVLSDSKAYITLTATANESEAERQATVTLSNSEGAEATITLRQLGRRIEVFPTEGFFSLNHSYPTVMSPMGKYIAYVENQIENNEAIYIPVIVNLETGEAARPVTIENETNIAGVSDHGDIIYNNKDSVQGFLMDVEGNITALEAPLAATQLRVNTISSDGTILGGYFTAVDKTVYPVIWNNKTPSIPAMNMTKDYMGDNKRLDMIIAYGSSMDGSIMSGVQTSTGGPVIYKNGEMFYLAQDAIEAVSLKFFVIHVDRTDEHEGIEYARPQYSSFPTTVSPNGKYSAIRFSSLKQIGDTVDARDNPLYWPLELLTLLDSRRFPMVVDLETGEYKIFDDDIVAEFTTTTVTNDGDVFFVASQTFFAPCYAYDKQSDSIIPAAEWVSQAYGLTVPSNIVITRVSGDGKSLIGYITELGAITYNKYCYIRVP